MENSGRDIASKVSSPPLPCQRFPLKRRNPRNQFVRQHRQLLRRLVGVDPGRLAAGAQIVLALGGIPGWNVSDVRSMRDVRTWTSISSSKGTDTGKVSGEDFLNRCQSCTSEAPGNIAEAWLFS